MEDYEAKARHGEVKAQMKIVSFPHLKPPGIWEILACRWKLLLWGILVSQSCVFFGGFEAWDVKG